MSRLSSRRRAPEALRPRLRDDISIYLAGRRPGRPPSRQLLVPGALSQKRRPAWNVKEARDLSSASMGGMSRSIGMRGGVQCVEKSRVGQNDK